jgi:hypothetical protein
MSLENINNSHWSNYMAKQKSSKKPKRGTGWSIWLILIVIHSFIASFATLSMMRTPDAVSRQWLITLLLIFTAAKAIAALGMWEWKTWGLYLYVIAVLGTMGVALVLTSFLIWGIFYEAIRFGHSQSTEYERRSWRLLPVLTSGRSLCTREGIKSLANSFTLRVPLPLRTNFHAYMVKFTDLHIIYDINGQNSEYHGEIS